MGVGGVGCFGGDSNKNDDVFFLLGDSLASVFYEDGTEYSETSSRKIQTPGNHPKRKNAKFRKRRKFEIKNDDIITSCDVAWKHGDNIIAISLYRAFHNVLSDYRHL